MTLEELEALIADAPRAPWEEQFNSTRKQAAMSAMVALWGEAPSLIAKIRELEISLAGSREARVQAADAHEQEMEHVRGEWQSVVTALGNAHYDTNVKNVLLRSGLNDAVSLLEIYGYYNTVPHPKLVELRALLQKP